MVSRLFLIEMRFTAVCSGLFSGFGVDCLYHTQQRTGESFDYGASRLVAFVEVVGLELPCEQHFGELPSGKLVIDILAFGREIHFIAVKGDEPLRMRLSSALP